MQSDEVINVGLGQGTIIRKWHKFLRNLQIRTNAEKAGPIDWRPAEDQKRAGECETSYVKMYQHSKVG